MEEEIYDIISRKISNDLLSSEIGPKSKEPQGLFKFFLSWRENQELSDKNIHSILADIYNENKNLKIQIDYLSKIARDREELEKERLNLSKARRNATKKLLRDAISSEEFDKILGVLLKDAYKEGRY